MQKGSGRPAGGDVSRSKTASSKPAATTAAGAGERGGSLGARGLGRVGDGVEGWGAGLGRREALPFGLGPGPNLEGRWGQEGEVRRWKLAESRSNVHQWGERPNVRCHGCHESWQLLEKVDFSQRLPKIPPSAFPAANS